VFVRLFSFILIFVSLGCSFDNDGSIENTADETEKEIRYLNADNESVLRAYTQTQQNLPELEDYFHENDLIRMKLKIF
jgi:hypothetical protein